MWRLRLQPYPESFVLSLPSFWFCFSSHDRTGVGYVNDEKSDILPFYQRPTLLSTTRFTPLMIVPTWQFYKQQLPWHFIIFLVMDDDSWCFGHAKDPPKVPSIAPALSILPLHCFRQEPALSNAKFCAIWRVWYRLLTLPLQDRDRTTSRFVSIVATDSF